MIAGVRLSSFCTRAGHKTARVSIWTACSRTTPRQACAPLVRSGSGFHKSRDLREAPVASNDVGKQELSKITPKYQITFTCKACDHRSSHQMSHQAYKTGTVLIQCPSCKNRHLIADNLKIFSDTNINIEDIVAQQGHTIQKGIASEGDLEFLPEESVKK